MEAIVPAISTVVFFNLVAALFCAPIIVAIVRRHHNVMPITVVNLLLGWSGVGWVVALAMAFSNPQPAPVVAISTS